MICDKGWREGSVGKSTRFPSRGAGFDIQESCDGSQKSVTPVSGDLATSFGIYVYQAFT